MISATIPSKRKRIPKQFFEAPAAATAPPAAAPPAAKKGGRMKTKAAGPRVAPRVVSRIGLAPPLSSKATAPPPSVPSDATPAPPPPTMDVDKVFDVESTTSYMDMLNESTVDLDAGIDAFDGEGNVEEIDDELLAEEREIMMMRTDGMDEDQLAWWKETKADIMARKKVACEARAASAQGESPNLVFAVSRYAFRTCSYIFVSFLFKFCKSPKLIRQEVGQVVVLKVSLHCKACAGKVKKHLSKMEGVRTFSIDFAAKNVTAVGDVTPLGVLTSVSKVKNAQSWAQRPPQPAMAA
ncbi:hypothetical protein ACQ4PT_002213 [Festuca glaucescens]